MAVPTALPPHPDFRKPLRSHDEIALVAGPREHRSKTIMEGDLELHRATGRHRLRKLHFKDSAVVAIAVVPCDKVYLRGQISHAHSFEGLDLSRRQVLRLPFEVAFVAPDFPYECRVRLKGIQVKMERKSILRLTGKIAIRQSLSRVERFLLGVKMRVDFIRHNPFR